jgi:hypothetical protein
MNIGFDRRFSSEQSDELGDGSMTSILTKAAKKTAAIFELEKSKEEQLKDLKIARMQQRSGIMKIVPQFLHKYIDYMRSLYKEPQKPELLKIVGIGAFFAFIVWANSSPRSAFMYFVIGKLAAMSALLGRGMPQVKPPPGGGRQKVGL